MAVQQRDFHQRRRFLLAILLIDSLDDDETVKTRDRVIWAREWLRRREERGAFHQLIRELSCEDDEAFTNYFRLNQVKFQYLTSRLDKRILKQSTMMRDAIGPAERLAVTLRYLATGETFSSLEKQFRICRTAISYIVVEVSFRVSDRL